jgi:hypothetical protein
MPRKVLSAIDVLLNLVFTAFNKVLWLVIITAFVTFTFTASMLILGYNLAK